MTRYIYPRYYELGRSAPLLARKPIIKACEEVGNISEVARVFGTTRKTVRRLLRRWEESQGLRTGRGGQGTHTAGFQTDDHECTCRR